MFREKVAAEFAPYAPLSREQLARLEAHYELLIHWNQKLNLTRIRDVSEAVRLHYCESMFVGHVLPEGPLKVVDVGSGGGFPGIPLAILRPEVTVDLIESHQRKAVFLREVSRELPNVRVVSNRAESCVGNWEWVVARALRPEQVLGFRLADKAALLMSLRDLQGLRSPESVRQIPWGTDRVLAQFHVKRTPSLDDSVPHETR